MLTKVNYVRDLNNNFLHFYNIIVTMNKKLKISFDFDGCLDRKVVQDFARSLILDGHDVWIVTTRLDDDTTIMNAKELNPDLTDGDLEIFKDTNESVFKVAKEIGIPKDKIIFTNHTWKHEFLEKNPGFHFHFDDVWKEHKLIQKHTKTIPLSVCGNTSFIGKFNRLKKKL